MKTCKKCGNEFEPTKGLNDYCSLKCRNSRNWSPIDKEKKSISAKQSEKVLIANRARNKETFSKMVKTRTYNNQEFILNADYSSLKFQQLRKRILFEQNSKCNQCGLDEWRGHSLVLELEHKDGNHLNNDRNNLEMICPNCHSLTDTWRGRNSRKKNRITDEDLMSALLDNEMNIRQSLLQIGFSPKGGNYKRCHRLIREYYAAVAE
jgi:Zn finger protein HypA/HybF involved in hydrogenase expression